MKIINYEKKEMIPLTNEEKESYENQQVCYICENEFCTDEENKKEFRKMEKVRDHCHYTGKYREAAHSYCNLKYQTTKKIPVVFHNGSAYDYHFIIKQLAREFKGYFECLGENTEKYITFFVPIKKVFDKDKDKGKDKRKIKTITYRLKFIDSYRFMQCTISNLVDNLSGNDKISEASLIEKFPNTYQLCNNDHNKFSLLLRKGIYPYEYMDCWEKLHDKSLPDKESFYSELNNEHITDEDYERAQKVWSTINIKN